MREIKFKAVTMENQIIEVGAIEFFSEGGIVVNDEIPVKELLEFTGLNDKNGKEIYEGDIVKQMDVDWNETPDNAEPDKYVMRETMRDVVTMERFPLFWLKNEHFGYEGEELVKSEDVEVIGDIYSNPELLKK